jgi:hypothetical protein
LDFSTFFDILKDISRHFSDISRHFSDISKHFSDISKHFSDISRHFQGSFVATYICTNSPKDRCGFWFYAGNIAANISPLLVAPIHNLILQGTFSIRICFLKGSAFLDMVGLKNRPLRCFKIQTKNKILRKNTLSAKKMLKKNI